MWDDEEYYGDESGSTDEPVQLPAFVVTPGADDSNVAPPEDFGTGEDDSFLNYLHDLENFFASQGSDDPFGDANQYAIDSTATPPPASPAQPAASTNPIAALAAGAARVLGALFGQPSGGTRPGTTAGSSSGGSLGSSSGSQQQRQKFLISSVRLPDGRMLNLWSDGSTTYTAATTTPPAAAAPSAAPVVALAGLGAAAFFLFR